MYPSKAASLALAALVNMYKWMKGKMRKVQRMGTWTVHQNKARLSAANNEFRGGPAAALGGVGLRGHGGLRERSALRQQGRQRHQVQVGISISGHYVGRRSSRLFPGRYSTNLLELADRIKYADEYEEADRLEIETLRLTKSNIRLASKVKVREGMKK